MGTAGGSALGIERVGQVAVTVRDIERATAFYRDVLGLRHLFSAPPRMAFFDDGAGLRILLGEAEPGQARPVSALLYYKVPDIDAAHARLVARGVTASGAPHLVAKLPDHELWLATYEDGEGNALALMSERR